MGDSNMQMCKTCRWFRALPLGWDSMGKCMHPQMYGKGSTRFGNDTCGYWEGQSNGL